MVVVLLKSVANFFGVSKFIMILVVCFVPLKMCGRHFLMTWERIIWSWLNPRVNNAVVKIGFEENLKFAQKNSQAGKDFDFQILQRSNQRKK